MESNGSSVRGNAVSSSDTRVIFTEKPAAGSTRASARQAYSIRTRVGSLGKWAAGSTGDFFSYAFGFFGGKSTTDMPTSGKADYAGTFEGLEQSAPTGLPVQTSNISGTATSRPTSRKDRARAHRRREQS